MDKEPTDSTIDYDNQEQGNTADVPQNDTNIQDGVLQVSDKPENKEMIQAESNVNGTILSVTIDETVGSGEPQSPENITTDETETASGKDSGKDSGLEVLSGSMDPLKQMETAASAAENDTNDIERARKIAQNNERHHVTATADNTPGSAQPVDVRQDFIDQMHNPKAGRGGKGLTTGKKIAIGVAVALLLIATGSLVWWFAYYSRPDVVVADAMGHLISAPSVNTNMVTTNVYKYGDIQEPSTVTASTQRHGLTEFLTHLEFDASGLSDAMDISDQDDESTESENSEEGVGLSADVMMLGGGFLFAKLDGLSTLPIEYTDDNEVITEAVGILEGIDGKWYQISIEEVLDLLGMEEETAKPIEDFYHCSIAVAGQDYSEELKAAYEQNPFLTATKSDAKPTMSGTKVYDININYDILANFLNTLPQLGMAESFYVCYNTMAESLGIDAISAGDFGAVNPEDLKGSMSHSLQAEIANFGHELVRFIMQTSDDDQSTEMVIDFDYAYRELAAPSEYWTAEDLVMAIKELWVALVGGVDTYPDTDDVSGEEFDDSEDDDWYDDDDWYYEEEDDF